MNKKIISSILSVILFIGGTTTLVKAQEIGLNNSNTCVEEIQPFGAPEVDAGGDISGGSHVHDRDTRYWTVHYQDKYGGWVTEQRSHYCCPCSCSRH